MECPACNHLNSAMAVHCINCRSVLIHEAVGHSKEFKAAVSSLDTRMYGRLGGLAGFFLSATLLKFVFTAHDLTDFEVYMAAMCAAVVGGFLGQRLHSAKENF